MQFVQLIVSLNSYLDLGMCIPTAFSPYSVPEDASSMFVRNVGNTANVHKVLSPKIISVLKYTHSATILAHSFLSIKKCLGKSEVRKHVLGMKGVLLFFITPVPYVCRCDKYNIARYARDARKNACQS